jgi:protein-S-isoprenylcysteine O-methyltransferase Ste14
MTDSTLFNALLIGVFTAAPLVFLSLLFSTAQYGRHNRKSAGPSLPTRAAWVFMECPSVFGFAYFFLTAPNAFRLVPFLLFLLWESHYAQRTLVYPFLMRVQQDDSMPIAIATSGFAFNVVNSYLNATWIGRFGVYPSAWLGDPRLLVGTALFVIGYVVNRRSDAILRNLRKPGDTGYKIPQGGLYDIVSCPNYFGEIVIWIGWTIATWSLAGLSFAVFTAANLVPRALANHRWYKQTFTDYPRRRRAVFPYVL